MTDSSHILKGVNHEGCGKKMACIASIMLIGHTSTIISAHANEVNIDQLRMSISQESVDFWFASPTGTRTFDIENNVIVPNVPPEDEITIEGDLINTYDKNGVLAGSIKADLPDGISLEYTNGVIYATGKNKCIENKWVSLGLNLAFDFLVCLPLGLGTGGIAGPACGAAAAAGVTAITC